MSAVTNRLYEPCFAEARWYAAQTAPNHEKRVAEHLDAKMVQHFLPLYTAKHRRKDRNVTLHRPLFPGYIFVRISLQDRLEVLKVPSVTRFVGPSRPTPVPDKDIDGIRHALATGLTAEPHAFLKVGRKVRIVSGPMRGMEGILSRRKGAARVVISLDVIMRSVVLELDINDIVPVR